MDTFMTFLTTPGPQHWFVLGLALLIVELVTGTSYLLWPAVAAFVTALAAWAGITSWAVEIGLFAVLVIVLTAFGRPLVQRLRNAGTGNGLNERGSQLVGARVTLVSFANGVGSAKVNDTVWRAVSDETLEAGQQVEVAAVDGATLKVRRVA